MKGDAYSELDHDDKQLSWPNYLLMLWGLWLISSPWSMGYSEFGMLISDTLSGFLLICLAVISLRFQLPQINWVAACIGLWVTFAPLVFWTSNSATYANGNLIGSLIIVNSIIIPSLFRKEDFNSKIPDGWNYNPSSWAQRIPVIGLAFMGFFFAKYLAAFQLGHISSVWEPFFGKGTETILRSDVSKAFPVSDAGLGAWSYLLDALSGLMGSTRRWRTMPWIVIFFGIMIIPPGVTSITLVVLQPVAVGSWCTLCLVTAVIMLFMVPPAIDEVVATTQFLIWSRKNGRSFWKTFWQGGDYPKELIPAQRVDTATQKQFLPWNLILSSLLGVWLMFAPTIFQILKPASHAGHLLGAVIVTFSVIAMAQVARMARWINLLFGLSLILAVWLLPGGNSGFLWSSTGVGVTLMVLSIPLGKITNHFGKYDRWVRWSPVPASIHKKSE